MGTQPGEATGRARLVTVVDRPAMGGRLMLRAAHPAAEDPARVAASLDSLGRRVDAWAGRLTRHSDRSALAMLNRTDPGAPARVGATLAAALAWAQEAEALTGGIVDVTLLDARLAAEDPAADGVGTGPTAWSLRADARGGWVTRALPCRFDLDGVGKGWIADRALDRMRRWDGALVDADGDIAVRVAPGDTWTIAVEDPDDPSRDLATIVIDDRHPAGRAGVATSGTSIHRWPDEVGDAPPRHHLIDPRTGRAAATDLVQVTVIAGSAREAETLAKAALILGGDEGAAFLDGSPARGALLLRTDRELVALPRTMRWLA